MAYMNPARAAADHGLRARFSALLADLAERRARYRLYRQTVDELSALTSRELADLGIHASQIHSIALEAARGK